MGGFYNLISYMNYMSYVDEIDVTVKYLDAIGNEVEEVFYYCYNGFCGNPLEGIFNILELYIASDLNDAGITNVQSVSFEGVSNAAYGSCFCDNEGNNLLYAVYRRDGIGFYGKNHSCSFNVAFDHVCNYYSRDVYCGNCYDVLRDFYFSVTLNEGEYFKDVAHELLDTLLLCFMSD